MIPPDRSDNALAAEFFMTLLHAATSGHILHLQTTSYAEHKALDEFYNELPDLVDSLIESYQGKYGRVLDYPSGYQVPVATPQEFVSNLGDYVMASRQAVATDSELQNDIDAIQTLINSTQYKLTFLR